MWFSYCGIGFCSNDYLSLKTNMEFGYKRNFRNSDLQQCQQAALAQMMYTSDVQNKNHQWLLCDHVHMQVHIIYWLHIVVYVDLNTHIKTSDTLYGEEMLPITSVTHIRYILNVRTVQRQYEYNILCSQSYYVYSHNIGCGHCCGMFQSKCSACWTFLLAAV